MTSELEGGSTFLNVTTRLLSASPTERAEILIAVSQQSLDNRVELGAQDGIVPILDGIDLSTRSEAGTLASGKSSFHLRQAVLRGVSLRGANLSGIDLTGADLREAVLRGACLDNCILERADLRGADLASATLRNAQLGKANLEGALLEEAVLRAATLRHANLERAVLENADLKSADFWGARLSEASLAGSDLRGVNFVESSLNGVDFSNADLRGAELRGADLTGAVLRNARLDDAVLEYSNLLGIHLSGSLLDNTRFRQEQIGPAIGEELCGDYEGARRAYLALERNFENLGDLDAATWAYRRRRRMGKKHSYQKARTAFTEKHVSIFKYANRYVGDQFAEWLCDYGESIGRVLASILVVQIFFAVVYGLTGSVVQVHDTVSGKVSVVTYDPLDLTVFSLLAMTTSGSPAVGLLPRTVWVHFLTGVQAMIGIALTGLLGFVLGNRIRR